MALRYVTGDATDPQGPRPLIIAHICNDRGGWGKGFVLALSKRWSEPEFYYRRWIAEARDKGLGVLGLTQIVDCDDGIFVANMVAQRGYRRSKLGLPLDYDALMKCLGALNAAAFQRKAPIHMPKIGTGLAGGDWSVIEPMVGTMAVDVTVYELEKR